MRGVCCVPNCKNDISTGGHGFPKDTTIRSRWLKKIKRPNWTPGKWSKICHHHFKPTDFVVFNSAGKIIFLSSSIKFYAVYKYDTNFM